MPGCKGASQQECATSLEGSLPPDWGHEAPLGEDIPAEPPPIICVLPVVPIPDVAVIPGGNPSV